MALDAETRLTKDKLYNTVPLKIAFLTRNLETTDNRPSANDQTHEIHVSLAVK